LVGLRDLVHAFPEVRFYAISPDRPNDSREFADKVASDGRGPLGFPLLSDVRSTVIDAYGLRDPAYSNQKQNGIPHPTVIVLDQSGVIRWMKIESDYRVRPTNEEVAAALDAFE
jgi:peroxiredoxin